MLSTSGPWPLVVAARILLSRSGQPITCEVDLDAGLLLELLQLRAEDLLVVLQARALVAGPVGQGLGVDPEEAPSVPPPHRRRWPRRPAPGQRADERSFTRTPRLELDRTGQLTAATGQPLEHLPGSVVTGHVTEPLPTESAPPSAVAGAAAVLCRTSRVEAGTWTRPRLPPVDEVEQVAGRQRAVAEVVAAQRRQRRPHQRRQRGVVPAQHGQVARHPHLGTRPRPRRDRRAAITSLP